jgi:hypothetical protein
MSDAGQSNDRPVEGPRRAGGLLPEAGVHREGDAIPEQNGIERLAYLRDQVVHKALRVSSADISAPLAAAREFVTSVAQRILGHDILYR